MANYFNQLSLQDKLHQLGQCRFMNLSEFNDGISVLKGKKIVIIGCGAQGLNQGLNMRDSGLDISYALRDDAIKEKRDIPILNLDIIEEAYIYSWIETSYKNVLAPFTNSFFKRTADINDYIKWYPHFYHGMNPTLPNKIT